MKFQEVRDNWLSIIQPKFYNVPLYKTNTPKDLIWDLYLDSFPMNRKQEFNCNCCKSFLRRFGNLVTINSDLTVNTLWNYQSDDPVFNKVFNNLHQLIISQVKINSIYDPGEAKLGTLSNAVDFDSKYYPRTWHHWYLDVGNLYTDMGSNKANELTSLKFTLANTLNKVQETALNQLIEKIKSNEVYRGQEFLLSVESLRDIYITYQSLYVDNALKADLYLWDMVVKRPDIARIKNTSIGTLITDVCSGESWEFSLRKFKNMMSSYKESSGTVTASQLERAKQVFIEEGYMTSLKREFATVDDLHPNNILWQTPTVKDYAPSNPFDTLQPTKAIQEVKVAKTVSLNTFISQVIPNSDSIKFLFEKTHEANLMSLIKASDPDSPNMFYWDNSFSWMYNGNSSDGLYERIIEAGGKVDGEVVHSLGWHHEDDYDLHLYTPNSGHVYHANKKMYGISLDVDMNWYNVVPDPVENICFSKDKKFPEGTYTLKVRNYTQRCSNKTEFPMVVRTKYGDTVFEHTSNARIPRGEFVTILTYKYENGKFIFPDNLTSVNISGKSTQMWGMYTDQWQEVKAITLSPNYWKTNRGNKHIFLFLDKCVNPSKTVHGYTNEFLKPELHQHHRQVLQVLKDKTMILWSQNQLSGVGFSTTIPKTFKAKVQKEGKIITYEVKI